LESGRRIISTLILGEVKAIAKISGNQISLAKFRRRKDVSVANGIRGPIPLDVLLPARELPNPFLNQNLRV
jgi:hypothetical protein